MADKVRVSDLDFVYISYQEPNKEENWADLLSKVPWAKRVDGVKGFDNAHKAAAEKAETDFFISVDGDNIIDDSFLLQTLDWSKTNPKAVHRWRARNNINDLVYGNGGLVGWQRETCLQMKTHENAKQKEAEIDFCWTVPHENLHNCYSTTVINAKPQQAWIAGYREGVKMSLNRGAKVKDLANDTWWQNHQRLLIWMQVGADVDNGIWSVMGARQGCYMTTCTDSNEFIQIRDLDKMADLFANALVEDKVDEDLEVYGNSIKQRIDIPCADFDEHQSNFFKFVMPRPFNKGVQDREYK